MKYSNSLVAVCISVTLLCISCSSPYLKSNSEQTTAILGAFPPEVVMLEEQLDDRCELKIEGIKFVTGRLKGRRSVIGWTGFGKVNAAMTTTLLIEYFRPNEVIFTGIAGGINPQLQPGDIVIAQKTAQHDLGTLTTEGIKCKGALNPIDVKRNPVFFPADKRLLKLTEQAAKQVYLEKIKTNEAERNPKIVKGVIVTGDIFIESTPKRIELRKRLGADAVEMEGAAVAQICYQQRVPYILIRSLSDKADENASQDLEKFYKVAAKNSASLTIKIIELLSRDTH